MSAQSRRPSGARRHPGARARRAAAAAGAGGGGVVQDRRHRRGVLRHQERRHAVVVGRQLQRRPRPRRPAAAGIPVQVGSATTWKSIVSFPGNGMIGLRSDGSLWRWGLPSRPRPTSYSGVPGWAGPWEQVTAGDGHVLLLTTRRRTLGLGRQRRGPARRRHAPAPGRRPRSTSGRSCGSPWPPARPTAWACKQRRHAVGVGRQRPAASSVSAARTRRPTHLRRRSAAATTGQAVFGWQNSSYALTDGGELYAWGSNEYGRLGIGSNAAERLTPKALAGSAWDDVAPGAAALRGRRKRRLSLGLRLQLRRGARPRAV